MKPLTETILFADPDLFREMPGAVAILQPDLPRFTIAAVTRDYLLACGRKENELLGKGLFEAFPVSPGATGADSQSHVLSSLKYVIQDRQEHSLPVHRYDIVGTDGQYRERYWATTNKPVLNASGEVVWIIHYIRDVTDQVKAKVKENHYRSLERSYNLFLQAPVVIGIVKGDQYIIDFANEDLLEVWGRTEEVIGKPLLEALPEFREQGFVELLEQVRESGNPFYAYERPIIIIKNGKENIHYFNFVYKAYYRDDEAVAEGVFAIGHDVTDLVIARQKAQENESKYRSLFSSMDQGFCIVEMEFDGEGNPVDYRYIETNPVFEQQTGLRNAVGRTIRELAPAIEPHWFRIYGKVAVTGEPVRFIEESKALNRWFEVYAFKMDGESKRIGIFFTDITKRKTAEDALLKSEANLLNMIHHAPVAMCIVTGADFIVEIANDRMYELWGKPASEMKNRPIFEGLPEARNQGLEPLLQHVYTTGETFSANEKAVVLPRDGRMETVYINFVYEPFRNAAGEITGVMAVAIDVTEQVIARLKVEAANQELQFVTDTMPQLVWAAEPDGNAIFFNRGWMEFSGYAPEQLYGYGWTSLLHPDDLAPTIKAWGKAVASSGAYDIEYRLKRSDGSYRWFVARGIPMKDGDGKVLKWYGTSTDINEQKLAAEALQKSHERFDLVARATQDTIWDWNLVTDQIWWNEGFKTMFGYRDADIEPGIESWYNRLHPDDRERVISGIHGVIDSGGKQWSDEYRFRKIDGSYASVLDRAYVLHDKEGNPYRMLGSMQDITARKEFEATLSQSEERFRTLANSISQLAWMADSEGWIYWYNQRFFDFTGTTLEEMQGWGWQKLHHPDYLDMVTAFVAEGWKKGEPWELTIPLKGKDGKFRWFLSRAFPIKDEAGKVTRWIGTNTDITEQKEAANLLEERVMERTKELEIRNRELEQFTYVSHHDLQEPLRKIIMFTEMVRTEEGDRISENGKRRLDRVNFAASRMSAALRDVLNFASLNKEEQFVQVDLNEVLDAVLSDLELVIQEKQAEVVADSLPVIKAVPQQMHQLFYNLVNNALKFSRMDLKPLIRIRCAVATQQDITRHRELPVNKNYYRIELSDNGIGFMQEAAEKIFDMFQRLHTRDAYAGTGIGLALVKKVVLNHSGAIRAVGEEGKGASFIILLPF